MNVRVPGDQDSDPEAAVGQNEPITHVHLELPAIQVYEDLTAGTGQRWRWRLKGANNEIMCTGEAHRDASDALRAVERVEAVFEASPHVVVLREARSGQDL